MGRLDGGPDDLCWDGRCYEVRWGALPPLPAGYSVWWHGEHEHYTAHGPRWESAITCDRFQARRWCFAHASEVRR